MDYHTMWYYVFPGKYTARACQILSDEYEDLVAADIRHDTHIRTALARNASTQAQTSSSPEACVSPSSSQKDQAGAPSPSGSQTGLPGSVPQAPHGDSNPPQASTSQRIAQEGLLHPTVGHLHPPGGNNPHQAKASQGLDQGGLLHPTGDQAAYCAPASHAQPDCNTGDIAQSHVGLWPHFSLLNHSCLPTCVHYVAGSTMVRAGAPCSARFAL
eukprot:1157914-Pelagomonas_calceolata.AAC.3